MTIVLDTPFPHGRRVSWTAMFPLVLLALLGSGAWTVRSADLPGEKVLFEENFTDAPDKGWSWLREIPNHWKIDKERNELLISPVWSEGNMKNIPLRAVPDVHESPLAIEVHIEHVPTGDYEYAGLIWYYDDKNFVVIRKGPHGDDGKLLSLVWRKADEGDGPASAPKKVIFNEPGVDLRMVIAGGKAQGWYRATSTDQWQSLGEVDLPGSGPAQVGFRTGNGESKQSWARFSKFRILQLARGG
jgi:hypothetical protein